MGSRRRAGLLVVLAFACVVNPQTSRLLLHDGVAAFNVSPFNLRANSRYTFSRKRVHCQASEKSNPFVLVGGENLIDFIQTSDVEDRPSYRANPGGSPYNVAKALGKQLRGAGTVGYLTPVSTDSLGTLLATELQSANVQLLSARRAEPTSLAVVSLQDGIPSYQFYRQDTAERMVSVESLAAATPDDAVALFLGSLALSGGADADVWAEFYVAQKKAGLFTVVDPNIRPSFILDRDQYLSRLDLVLSHTDLIKLSDEDLQWIDPQTTDLRSAASQLLSRSSALITVVTKGADGAFALTRDGKEFDVDAAPLSCLRDTVGAGDTFTATLLASLATKGSLNVDALRALTPADVDALLWRASCAAALNCEREGCNPPDGMQVDAAVAKLGQQPYADFRCGEGD